MVKTINPTLYVLTVLFASEEDRNFLKRLRQSRREQVLRLERAKISCTTLGMKSSAIAVLMQLRVTSVDKCINKALKFGIHKALEDFKRSGRPVELTAEARAWIVSLAYQKPKELGYSYELWTMKLLAQHVREHAVEQGIRARHKWQKAPFRDFSLLKS